MIQNAIEMIINKKKKQISKKDWVVDKQVNDAIQNIKWNNESLPIELINAVIIRCVLVIHFIYM